MSQTIIVRAPETLAEGYRFDVFVEDEPYTITVPPGGVVKDEEFEVPYHPTRMYDSDSDDEHASYASRTLAMQSSSRSNDENLEKEDNQHQEKELKNTQAEDETEKEPSKRGQTSKSGGQGSRRHMSRKTSSKTNKKKLKKNTKSSSTLSLPKSDSIGAPYGIWRYPLLACCDVLTQATFWMACCCTPVFVAQLLTRLGLDWNGNTPESSEHAAQTFNRIVLSYVAVLMIGLWIPVLGQTLWFVYMICLLVGVGRKLRQSVRERYRIKAWTEQKQCPAVCIPLEDGLCQCLCGPCSLIQMGRHTHNDKEYPGMCCTTTGLEFDAPGIEECSDLEKQM